MTKRKGGKSGQHHHHTDTKRPKAAGGQQHAHESLTAQVSAAFTDAAKTGQWDAVVKALEVLRRSGEVPKLGTVQRWVRLADLTGVEKTTASLLAAVLRCIPGSSGPVASMAAPKSNKHGKKAAGPIRRHEPWLPPLSPQQQQWQAAESAAAATTSTEPAPITTLRTADDYRLLMTLVEQDGSTQPAKRPPNWSELQIWRPAPETIHMEETPPKVVRVDVPFVPGAFVMTGLFSPGECRQLIAATEACGYRWDVDYTFNPSNPSSAALAAPDHDDTKPDTQDNQKPTTASPQPQPQPQPVTDQPQQEAAPASSARPDAASSDGDQQQQQHDTAQQHPLLSAARVIAGGDRAAGCVWLAEDNFLDTLFKRAAPHMPQRIHGKALAGINARLRFYRYDQGNVYRPHVDGAWPGSGLKDGKLCHDAFGDRWSQLTFLVYLNDNFNGGSTTFFTPALDDPSALDARSVRPRAGNVLCFPHGDTAASLVHEGSAVTKGAKYVIRTDVLYYTTPAAATTHTKAHV